MVRGNTGRRGGRRAGRQAGKRVGGDEDGKNEEELVEEGTRDRNEGGKTATRGRIGVKDSRRREGRRPKRRRAENGLGVK